MPHQLDPFGLGVIIGSSILLILGIVGPSIFLIMKIKPLPNCILLGIGLLIFITDERILDWCYHKVVAKEGKTE